ncbi:MAG: MlaD family protein [Actinomycetota bacterium]|nr:MlaD family protein [Actinomycetota bacterium]
MRSDEEGQGTTRTRVLAALAALGFVVLLWFLFLRGGEEYRITAEFESASQLVEGNEVSIGGVGVGLIDRIDLGPNGQALVTFSVDEEHAPLRRGTTATVRWRSLSSQAAREVQLTVPPTGAGGEEIPDGGSLSQSETVGEVDIDQFFNTLDEKTTRGLKRVIQGFERSYEGVETEARAGFKYLNPLFYQSRRTFADLTSDNAMLDRFVVSLSSFSGALADRAPDVSALVGNLNRMMNAIGDRGEQLSEAIRVFPNFLRRANTTFVNTRAALDDIEPLVIASVPVAEELSPYLDELRGFASNAVPTVRDLSKIVRRPGDGNDLIELQRLQPKVTKRAVGSGSPDCGPDTGEREDVLVAADDDFSQGSFGESVCSLRNGEDNLEFFRAYAPELIAWFDGFSHSGYADALGGVGRVSTTFNTFSQSITGVPDFLDPDTATEQFDALTLGHTQRCPGSAERPVTDLDPNDDSVPFTDDGDLTDGEGGNCEPDQIIPGP